MRDGNIGGFIILSKERRDEKKLYTKQITFDYSANVMNHPTGLLLILQISLLLLLNVQSRLRVSKARGVLCL